MAILLWLDFDQLQSPAHLLCLPAGASIPGLSLSGTTPPATAFKSLLDMSRLAIMGHSCSLLLACACLACLPCQKTMRFCDSAGNALRLQTIDVYGDDGCLLLAGASIPGLSLSGRSDPATAFKSILDMNRLAIMGHSCGGATAAAAVAQHGEFKAGVALDPWWPLLPSQSAALMGWQTRSPLLVLGSQVVYVFNFMIELILVCKAVCCCLAG